MDYAKIIEELIAGYDLSTRDGRSEAYTKCEDYAFENIRGRRAFNDFMRAVSDRLGTLPVRLDDFSEEVGEPSENAKLHLSYTPRTGPVLTGNAEGLEYLAALRNELARERVEHDHAHFWTNEPPLYGRSQPLVIYHEPDTWFERLKEKEEREKQNSETIAHRDIDPVEIAALCILTEIPVKMRMTPRRPYRVLGVSEYQGEGIWEKRLRDSNERFRVFTLVNDEGVEGKFGFDLDDPEVLFFTRQDLENLLKID
ncbi:MAG: hypothetical protein JSW27_12675 [Phycisphaerales bacterium]|nr:MAG: hypothetical protein JSW27_12675 [Phycisphaerales bacterium]